MDKKNLFRGLSIVFLAAILFTPTESKAWFYFLILGLVCGISWFR